MVLSIYMFNVLQFSTCSSGCLQYVKYALLVQEHTGTKGQQSRMHSSDIE